MPNELTTNRPQTFDLRNALAIPAASLTFRQAVFVALELLKGASPVLAKHFDSVPNVLVAFEVTLGEYAPDVIREAVVRMLRSMKRETRDVIPDAPRLADYCEDVVADRAREARERREADEKARIVAEDAAEAIRVAAMTDEEREAEQKRIERNLARLRSIVSGVGVPKALDGVEATGETLTPEEHRRRVEAAKRKLEE